MSKDIERESLDKVGRLFSAKEFETFFAPNLPNRVETENETVIGGDGQVTFEMIKDIERTLISRKGFQPCNYIVVLDARFKKLMILAKYYKAGTLLIRRNYHSQGKKNRYRKTFRVPNLKPLDSNCIENNGIKIHRLPRELSSCIIPSITPLAISLERR